MDFADGEAADDECGALGAGVSAGLGDNGYEPYNEHGADEEWGERADEVGGDGADGEEQDEPRDTAEYEAEYGALQVGAIVRSKRAHAIDILGLFLADDIEHIVKGNDAEDAPEVIAHREGDEIV